MVHCKRDCIYAEHGICTKEDILIGIGGCLSMRQNNTSVEEAPIEKIGIGNNILADAFENW